jgi:hypothetical protein
LIHQTSENTMATTQQVFSTEISNGEKYVSTTYRGTEYTLKLGAFGWEVRTRRIGYGGRFHMGGFKRFDALADLVAGCKAFGGAANVVAIYYGISA